MKLNSNQLTKRTGLVILAVFLLAAYLRFSGLGQVPPGLHPLEASLGLKAAASNTLRHFSNIQTLLSVWAIKFSGVWLKNKTLALRLPAAVFSLVGLVCFWLWLKHLFGGRVALIGAVLAASTPWVLNISRFGTGYSLALSFIAASLLFLAKAWEKPTVSRITLAFIITALGLYSDPVYNWYIFALILIGLAASPLIISQYRRGKLPQLSIGGLLWLLVAAPAAPAVVTNAFDIFKSLPHHFLKGLGDVFAVLWLKSPSGFDFNLSGLPLLNVFLALMLLLGILATFTRLRPKNHRLVIALFAAALIPGVVLAGSNNLATQTLLLVWPTFALIALGAEYLLGQWLKTFPQNNAARQLGGIMLLVLILLSVREGYNQYFLAWPASTETKQAYRQGAVSAQSYLVADKFNGAQFLVGESDDLTVVSYLGLNGAAGLTAEQLKSLTKDKKPRRFVVLPAAKSQSFKVFADKYPGGKLEAKLDQNGAESFLVYTFQP